jgi:hypothetical protein
LKILVDTEALIHSGTPEFSFWKVVLPKLVSASNQHVFYILERGGEDNVWDPDAAVVLHAPSCDFDNHVIEDRRLAALCAELEVETFISTFYTSAGASVNSVFVAVDGFDGSIHRNRKLRRAAVRAAKLASTRIAVSDRAAGHVTALSGLAPNHTMSSSMNPAGSAAVIARAFYCATRAEVQMVRDSQENALTAESHRLRKISERKFVAAWNRARAGGPLLLRIMKAIVNVRRYPEFIRRTRRSLRDKL